MLTLDTTVLIDLMASPKRAVRQRADAFVRKQMGDGMTLCTTRFNEAELLLGIERSSDPDAERLRVENVIAMLPILDFDQAAARHFAKITAHLWDQGLPIGDLDVLIASIVLANGHTLVTRNIKHFSQVPGLPIETY
jgi:tRNA(fMet)-specific endonuclease VapC